MLSADPQAAVPLVGLRGKVVDRLLGRLGRRQGARVPVAAGALFAFSFDTLSQSAVFAVMAVQFGGIEHALTFGMLFVLGMMASDGANGWWMSHLIGRTDRMAVLASRAMTMAVACVSLLVAGIGATRLFSREFEGWVEGRELAIGAAVIVLIGASFLAASRMAALRRTQGAGS